MSKVIVEKSSKKRYIGILLAALAGVLYGISSFTAKQSYIGGATAIVITFLRNLTAVLLLFAYNNTRKIRIKLPGRMLCELAFAALFISFLVPVFLYESLQYIPSGLTFSVNYSYPILLTLIYVFAFHEKVNARKCIATFLSVIGIWVIMFSAKGANVKGVLLAVGSGVCYAIYLIIVDRTSIKALEGTVCSMYCSLFSCFYLFVFGMVRGENMFGTTRAGLPWIILTGIIVVCLGNALIPEAIKRVGPTTVSILGILEPLTSLLISIMLFGDVITGRMFIGIIMILIGTMLIIIERGNSNEQRELYNPSSGE